jgi:hypothetical protein
MHGVTWGFLILNRGRQQLGNIWIQHSCIPKEEYYISQVGLFKKQTDMHNQLLCIFLQVAWRPIIIWKFMQQLLRTEEGRLTCPHKEETALWVIQWNSFLSKYQSLIFPVPQHYQCTLYYSTYRQKKMSWLVKVIRYRNSGLSVEAHGCNPR